MYRQAFLVTARSFTRARSSHKLLRVVAIARQHACVSVYSVACVTNDEMHACVCDHANVRDAYNHAPSISRPRCFHTIRPYQNVRMRLCLYRIFLCLLPLFAFPSPVFLSLSLSLSFFIFDSPILISVYFLPLASCLLPLALFLRSQPLHSFPSAFFYLKEVFETDFILYRSLQLTNKSIGVKTGLLCTILCKSDKLIIFCSIFIEKCNLEF